jgi:hypothetical protein
MYKMAPFHITSDPWPEYMSIENPELEVAGEQF